MQFWAASLTFDFTPFPVLLLMFIYFLFEPIYTHTLNFQFIFKGNPMFESLYALK